jgi:hypothetical protein
MIDIKDKLDFVLDMSDPEFAEKLREAIGLQPGETLEITTPQFDRTDRLVVPKPLMDFGRLPFLSEETLVAIGCQQWSDPDAEGRTLWLFPAEWYDHIPDGTIVTAISGRTEPFKHGKTDNDRRFGALAYGFYKKEAKSDAIRARKP